MRISDADRKLLWSRAGDQCAFPECTQALTVDEHTSDGTAKGVVLGHEAHIVADKDDGPRGEPSMPIAERHAYPNRMLLCPTHHNRVDKGHGIYYSAADLHKMKRAHELKVRRWCEERESTEQQNRRLRREVILEAASASRARLITRWVALGVDSELAEELADDQQVGAWSRLGAELPENGLVVLEGDFGTGKSVIAERVHFDCLQKALNSPDDPIPVFLKAQAVTGSLADAVLVLAEEIGEARKLGIRLTIDGLDEPGLGLAQEILNEADTLVRSWPNSRAIVSVRPGLIELENRTIIRVPPLGEDEAATLVERLGAHRSILYNELPTIREMLHLPLFTVIAATLYRAGSKIPRSRGSFLEALARQVMDRQHPHDASVWPALRELARLTIEASGTVAAAELGSSDKVRLVLETRLVARGKRTLSFALPILEQFFAAEAVLEDGLDASILSDPSMLERWRYALLMAVTIGPWKKVFELLSYIIDKHPGLASWLVANAIPDYDNGSEMDLPNDLECGRRVRNTLAAWLEGLPAAAPFTGLTRADGSVRTLGVRGNSRSLTMGLSIATSDDADVVRFPDGFHPFYFTSPDGTPWRPAKSSHPPADFPSWPWRWSLDWVASGIESLLTSPGLTLPDCESFQSESRWALARALKGESSNARHGPIEISGLLRDIESLVVTLDSGSIGDQRFRLQPSTLRSNRQEILELRDWLREQNTEGSDGLFHRPYPAPDNLQPSGQWVSDLYTDEALRALVERVYGSALVIYGSLVDTYFPQLAPMLGLACVLPVRITGLLSTREEAFGAGLRYEMEPLPPGTISRTEIALETIEQRRGWNHDAMLAKWQRVRSLIAEYHPQSQAWARLKAYDTVLEVYRDRPATMQARAWLWDDLRELKLVAKQTPVGEL